MSCVDDGFGGGGSRVGGSGGDVLSWVVRGLCKSVLVEGLVEGLSIASITKEITTIATSNDNDIDDNDDNDEPRRATFNAGHVDAPPARDKTPACGCLLSSRIKDRVQERRCGTGNDHWM